MAEFDIHLLHFQSHWISQCSETTLSFLMPYWKALPNFYDSMQGSNELLHSREGKNFRLRRSNSQSWWLIPGKAVGLAWFWSETEMSWNVHRKVTTMNYHNQSCALHTWASIWFNDIQWHAWVDVLKYLMFILQAEHIPPCPVLGYVLLKECQKMACKIQLLQCVCCAHLGLPQQVKPWSKAIRNITIHAQVDTEFFVKPL